MANHKSAAKRARQNIRKGARNSQTKKTLRTIEKKLRNSIDGKATEEAQSLLVLFTKKVDKAAQKGIIHANKAARKVSRLAAQIHGLAK